MNFILIHEYNTRNRNNWVVKYCRLKRCQNGYLAVKFYNKLPKCTRILPAMQFKDTCKRVLIDSFDEYLNCDFNDT